jgi:phosphatidylserine/phosphatidylglycerophosphate/cardiolipin synthase-like enzyme
MNTNIYIGKQLVHALPSIIRSARKEIRLAMYQLSPPTGRQHAALGEIWRALQAAPGKGIECRAILCAGSKIIPASEQAERSRRELERCGWIARTIDSTVLMHAKMLIIDSERYLVGSHNWTQAGLLCNHEVSVLEENRIPACMLSHWHHQMLIKEM